MIELEKESDLFAQAHFALAGLYRKQGKAEDADREMGEFKKLQTIGNQPDPSHP